MFFNTITNGDPRSFMFYKGDFYIDGTEIEFSDQFIHNNTVNGKKIWKYARFDHQETDINGHTVYFFTNKKFSHAEISLMGLNPNTTKMEYSTFVRVYAFSLESAIGKITYPIKLDRKDTEAVIDAIATPKSDFDNPGLIVLWIVYVAIMIGSLIFKQFYIIWVVVTLLFINARKNLQ